VFGTSEPPGPRRPNRRPRAQLVHEGASDRQRQRSRNSGVRFQLSSSVSAYQMAKKTRIVNPEGPASLEQHKLELARGLLDDIELARSAPEQMLLKASRLARLVDDTETRTWLEFELRGYPNTDQGRALMTRFNRWTQQEMQQGYWMPFASLGAWASAMHAEIQQLRVPDVSFSVSSANPHEWVTGGYGQNASRVSEPIQTITQTLQQRSHSIAQFREIQSRVIAAVHDFAVRTYYQLAFSGASSSIFRDHQSEIDALLREHSPEVLEKIPAIVARLAEGQAEAISQAMNSCRRMIKAFADTVQPPSDETVHVDGAPYEIGSDKVLNRIQYFLHQNCKQTGRRDRLRRNLRAIWDRASAGTHADADASEARAIFLQTYLTLGEILAACRQSRAHGA
jgi:hypothetical protein